MKTCECLNSLQLTNNRYFISQAPFLWVIFYLRGILCSSELCLSSVIFCSFDFEYHQLKKYKFMIRTQTLRKSISWICCFFYTFILQFTITIFFDVCYWSYYFYFIIYRYLVSCCPITSSGRWGSIVFGTE